ncbi:MAG TPA: DUF2398 family protein [Polyangiaceae bacterium]|jgi:hypothetical protein
MSMYFEKIARTRVQAILNVLVEAPFFYRDDDPDLFAFLRKHRADFTRFYEDLYDWRLVIDNRCARLYKTRWYNRALKPSQHDVFELTRRDECIAFLIVLEFYEHLLDERNVDVDDLEPLRFEFGQLFAFARERLQSELGDGAPDEDGVRRLLRDLVPNLLRYRFLREIPPERDERDGLDRDRWLYECLPALHHYDVRALGQSALRDAALGREGEPHSRDEEPSP